MSPNLLFFSSSILFLLGPSNPSGQRPLRGDAVAGNPGERHGREVGRVGDVDGGPDDPVGGGDPVGVQHVVAQPAEVVAAPAEHLEFLVRGEERSVCNFPLPPQKKTRRARGLGPELGGTTKDRTDRRFDRSTDNTRFRKLCI